MEQVEGFILKQPEVDRAWSACSASASRASGQNAGAGLRARSRTGTSARAPSIRRRRSPGRAFGALSGVRDAFIFPLEPAADPRARHRHRLHLPPAGPRRQRPRRRWSPRATSCWAWPAQSKVLARRAPRRPGRRAAAADRHRPRQGQRAGRVASTTINAALSTALGSAYVNDFPNAGPPAARGGAGRCAGAHAARRPAAAQRRSTARASRCRCRPSPRRAGSPAPMQTDPLQRLSGDAHLRRRRARATAPATAMDEMERLAGAAAGRLRLRMDRPVARGEASRARRRIDPATASRCWRCSCAWRRCTRAGRSRWR